MGHDLSSTALPPSQPAVYYDGQLHHPPQGESPFAAHAVPPEAARSSGIASSSKSAVGHPEVQAPVEQQVQKSVQQALTDAKAATRELVHWTTGLPAIMNATDSGEFHKLAPEIKALNELAQVAHRKVKDLEPTNLDTTSIHSALDTVGLLVKKTNEAYEKVQSIPVSEVKKKNFFTALSAILGAAATATAALLAAPFVLGVTIIAPPIGIALAGVLAAGFVASMVARSRYDPPMQRDVKEQLDRASVNQLAMLSQSNLELYRVLIASVAADDPPPRPRGEIAPQQFDANPDDAS